MVCFKHFSVTFQSYGLYIINNYVIFMNNLNTTTNCIFIMGITLKEEFVANMFQILILESGCLKAGSIITRLWPLLLCLILLNTIYQQISIATSCLIDRYHLFELLRNTVNYSYFIMFFSLILINLTHTIMMIILQYIISINI